MKGLRRSAREIGIVGACALLLATTAPRGFSQEVPEKIEVVVVVGEGVTHGAGQRVQSDPVVRVQDEKGKPLPEATIVFTLPASGSGGDFANGSKNLTVLTDEQGSATATGIRTNQLNGEFQIYVTATYRGLRGRALITQFVEGGTGAKKSSGGKGKMALILALVGGGAAAGIIAATSGGGGSSTSPGPTPPPATAIGITPGAPTISPPR